MTRRASKPRQNSTLREQHNAQTDDRFMGWMDAIAAPLLLLTPQAKILYSNRHLRHLTGQSATDLHQQYLWEVAPATEQAVLKTALTPLGQNQDPLTAAMTWKGSAGASISLEWTIAPLPAVYHQDGTWVATGQVVSHSLAQDTVSAQAAAGHTSLTQSPEDLLALIESSTDFVALADMEGQLTFVNPCGRELVGLQDLQAVQQTTIADYFFDEEVERLRDDILPTIAHDGSWQGELAMRHFQTGEAIPVLFNSTLVRHPQSGEPIGLGTVGRNITAVKRMEQEHQAAEVSFHSLMVGTVAVTGQEFFPTFVEQVAKSMGVSHALVTELKGDHLQTLAFWSVDQLQPNFTYAYSQTPCELSLQEGTYACPVGVQESFPQDSDLSALNAESYLGVAMKNRRGDLIGNLCLIDTKPLKNLERMETILRIFASRAAAELERQRATDALEALNHSVEKALQDSQTLLKLVLDTLPLAIFWKDRHCRFLGCNQQMLKDAGLVAVADIIGKTDFDLPWRQEATRYRADDRAVMETGQPRLNIEEPITKTGNVYRWLLTNKMPLRNSAGEIIGVLGVYEDITDRKVMETQLRQSHNNLALANQELAHATRLKDEFLANISHELRTPLSSILGMTQALSREIYGPLTERQHCSLAIIERSGRHLLELINNLLDVAKIEAGKLELQVGDVAIAQLCQDSIALVQQQALQKHIDLNVTIEPGLKTLSGDELRLRQALTHLLDNAIKFTSESGTVDLQVYGTSSPPDPLPPEQKVIAISVVDTGIGIAPADQARLFETFVQVNSGLTRQYFGTGLGLAMVKHIAELHQGGVEVDSQPGQGSRFTLYLPAS